MTQSSASANQSGPTVNDNATAQINACRALGGWVDVETDRTVGGLHEVKVWCYGGLLDGLWCRNNSDGTRCHINRSMQSPDDMPTAEPVGGGAIAFGAGSDIDADAIAAELEAEANRKLSEAADNNQDRGKGKHKHQGGKNRKR